MCLAGFSPLSRSVHGHRLSEWSLLNLLYPEDDSHSPRSALTYNTIAGMDPVPPDSKRPRIAPHGAPLPHLQTSSHLPPPIPQQHSHHPQHLQHPHPHPHQHQPTLPPPPPHSSSYPSYPPRAIEPTTASPAHAGPSHPRHEADRRHHDQEPYAPMQDHHYRQQPPPSPAHAPYQQHQPYPPPREGIVKREGPYEDHSRRSSSTGHTLEGAPAVQPVPTHQHQLPPYADGQQRHMSYDHGPPSVPPTPGGYRTPAYPPPTPVAQYEHPSYSSNEAYFNVYSSSSKKKNTRASQVRIDSLSF